MACAMSTEVTPTQRILGKVARRAPTVATDVANPIDSATEDTISESDRDQLIDAAERLVERVFRDDMSLVDAAESVLWASAMPGSSDVLPPELWWHCGEQLLQLRADASLRSDPTSPLHLLLAGELGLTLAAQLSVLPSCRKLTESSLDTVAAFLDGEGESIDRSLVPANQIRLVVASLVRCERLFPVVSKRKLKKRQREIAAEFATWMAVLTRHDGSQVFSGASAEQCEIDYAAAKSGTTRSTQKDRKKKTSTSSSVSKEQPDLHGLMLAASCFDSETLAPAMAAALGQSHSGGRLAWEISLPEAMWHSETASTFAMLPEWDVRRGRTFVDYSGEDVAVEIMSGRRSLIQGVHQTMITLGGVDQQPIGDWECTCEYSDDDVHLIELEQTFSGGVVLQRQWMLVRDDRCLMVSDAVLPSSKTGTAKDSSTAVDPNTEIRCTSRLPLVVGVEVVQDEQTRELVLTDGKKRRAMVMPLAANEWRVGPSACQVSVSDDNHLVVTTTGRGALYSPVWFDFQTRRFDRKRTWRQLTIAEQLVIVPRNVGAAFRVQIGSEHWVVYRSMSGRGPRSVMGRHLIADFFAARFHPGDGGMEELVTVDDTSENE